MDDNITISNQIHTNDKKLSCRIKNTVKDTTNSRMNSSPSFNLTISSSESLVLKLESRRKHLEDFSIYDSEGLLDLEKIDNGSFLKKLPTD